MASAVFQRYNVRSYGSLELIMKPLKSWEQVEFSNQHLSGKVTETLLNIRALVASFDEHNDTTEWSASKLKLEIDYVFSEGNEHDYALAFILLEGKRTPRLYMLHTLCAWTQGQTDPGQEMLFDWDKALLKEAEYWHGTSEAKRDDQHESMPIKTDQTMTREEAEIVFRDWQAYEEVNDKLFQLFGPSIPKSFLPYPPEVLEKAMNIMASVYLEAGDGRAYTMLQQNLSTLLFYKDDEEAVNGIISGIRLNHAKLRSIFINKLQKSRDSWAQIKGYQPGSQ